MPLQFHTAAEVTHPLFFILVNEAETENTFDSLTLQTKLSFTASDCSCLWFCADIFLIHTKTWCLGHIVLYSLHHSKCYYSAHGIPLRGLIWRLLLSQGGLIIINSMERTRLAPLPCMHLLTDCIDTLMLRWGDWCEVRVILSIVSAALRLRECLRLNGPQALLRCCLVSFEPVLAGHHVVKGHLDNHSVKRSRSSDETVIWASRWREAGSLYRWCTAVSHGLQYVFNII